MTATGLYVGQPEEWLLDHRTSILAALREGAAGRVSSISGATKSLSRLHMTPDELRTELTEVNYALWKIRPSTYPNPAPKKMLRADFSGQ